MTSVGSIVAMPLRTSKTSRPSEYTRTRLPTEAESAGADVIFSACSSLGPALDVARELVDTPIIKIDDAMTQRAAEQGTEIGVMATVPTTLGPTANLVKQHAARLGRSIRVHPKLCEGAFDILIAGRKDEHYGMVLAAAKQLAAEVDLDPPRAGLDGAPRPAALTGDRARRPRKSAAWGQAGVA